MVAIAEQTPDVVLALEWIEVEQIKPSPHNHRKIFRGIPELGLSMRSDGQKVPCKVRPNPNAPYDDQPYELVAGERRLRGAKSAGIAKLLCLVEEMTDEQVIVEQVIENVSRADVHPLEEADGYDELLKKHGYTVDQLVEKTGKSRTAIYNRLKLLDLPPAARDAFLADRIVASVAEKIARIPTPRFREQATEMIIAGRRAASWQVASPDIAPTVPREGFELDGEETVAFSVREVDILIQRHFMLRLEQASFDTADEKLTNAGACTKCVHRTGNQPDLFGDVASADVCTNPPCFEEKKAADWDLRSAAAHVEGKEIMPLEVAAEQFQGDRLHYASPFVDLDAPASWEFQSENRKKEKTWREALGKLAPAVTLARDEGGAAHELVDKRAALANLKDAGKLPKAIVEAEAHAGSATNDKKARDKRDVMRRTAELAIAEIAADNFAGLKPALWLAECVIRQASPDAHEATCRRRAIEPKKGVKTAGMRKAREIALIDVARGMKEAEELNGLVRELLAWELAVTHAGWGTNLVDAAKVFKVDLGKIRKGVEAERKQSAKPKKGGK